MRFVGFVACVFAVATGGCATHPAPPVNAPPMAANQTASHPAGQTPASQISGVWDALSRTTIGQGIGAGDTRIEKQEWHLSQAGSAISGYYITALTFVSGDGRPYVCNRLPQFSATQRFNVAGEVRGGQIEIEEKEQRATEKGNRCDPGQKRLARYSGRLEGDVMTLMSGLVDTASRYTKRAMEGSEKGNERVAALIRERKQRYRPEMEAAIPSVGLRARPDLLLLDEDDAMEEDEKEEDKLPTKDIVKPKKMKLLQSALDDGPTDKERRLNQKAKRMAQRSSLVREIRSQLHDGPEEIVDRKESTGERGELIGLYPQFRTIHAQLL